jgi:hypothetical protein
VHTEKSKYIEKEKCLGIEKYLPENNIDIGTVEKSN